jgi:hypothetical protein
MKVGDTAHLPQAEYPYTFAMGLGILDYSPTWPA